MIVRQPAHAKLNLFLRIVEKRPDGYHEIETLFQKIQLHDQLQFETTSGKGVELQIQGVAVPVEKPDDNLVVRAAHALREHARRNPGQTPAAPPPPGLRVQLRKNIPLAAGLGGGSSDAAAALLALNRLWGLGLPAATLAEIALGLGADVPFFLGGGAAVARGIGEKLTPFSHEAHFHAVLALPPFGVSTADVYRQFNPDAPAVPETGPSQNGVQVQTGAPNLSALTGALARADLPEVLRRLHNTLEPLAFRLHPPLGQLRQALEDIAQRPVRMTGSGSTLYTLAETEAEARQIAQAWQPAVPAQSTRFNSE